MQLSVLHAHCTQTYWMRIDSNIIVIQPLYSNSYVKAKALISKYISQLHDQKNKAETFSRI